ncbi:MAG: ABC transporter ATP-binding protein [Jhaorihella sp.]
MSEAVIEAAGLTRRFGDTLAVDTVDLRIDKGMIYGFLGPNGSGKTTLMRMLTGLLRPTEGRATVLGTALPGNAEPLKRRIGYMTQSFSHYRDLSVAENLRFAAEIHGLTRRERRARIDELLEGYDLKAHAAQLAGNLSGGQRQRLALAAAVLHRPQLLFLDEPTSAVDPESRRAFWEQLFDLVDAGASIIVSTHFMDEAERCHRIAILDNGAKCADGPPPQLMQDLAAVAVEVTGGNLRQAKRDLEGQAGILSAAQIGERLRVLVDLSVPDPEAKVMRIIGTTGKTCSLTRANLEDVFVMATRGGGA